MTDASIDANPANPNADGAANDGAADGTSMDGAQGDACLELEDDGLFDSCDPCDSIGAACNTVVQETTTGYACGCPADGCPCGTSCGCIPIPPGIDFCNVCAPSTL